MAAHNIAAGNLMVTTTGRGLHFNFTDWLGTKRVQVNANGTVEQTSLPFGDAPHLLRPRHCSFRLG